MEPLPRASFSEAAMHFKGEDFQVNWHRFTRNSARFRHQPFPTGGVSIMSDVSREAVVEFIKASSNQEFIVSSDIAHDLVVLSTEFGVEVLQNRVTDWISSHEFELLIPALLFEVKQNIDTSKTELKVREHFESVMSDPQLLDLPLSVVARVIRTDIDNFPAFFFFLKQCLNRFGSAGSILFKNFDICKLNIDEIREIENDARLDWSVVGSQGGEQVVGLVSRCLRSERRVAELIEENKELRRQTEDIVHKLKSSLATFEGKLEANLGS
jgi:hypothetical protein